MSFLQNISENENQVTYKMPYVFINNEQSTKLKKQKQKRTFSIN